MLTVDYLKSLSQACVLFKDLQTRIQCFGLCLDEIDVLHAWIRFIHELFAKRKKPYSIYFRAYQGFLVATSSKFVHQPLMDVLVGLNPRDRRYDIEILAGAHVAFRGTLPYLVHIRETCRTSSYSSRELTIESVAPYLGDQQ